MSLTIKLAIASDTRILFILDCCFSWLLISSCFSFWVFEGWPIIYNTCFLKVTLLREARLPCLKKYIPRLLVWTPITKSVQELMLVSKLWSNIYLNMNIIIFQCNLRFIYNVLFYLFLSCSISIWHQDLLVTYHLPSHLNHAHCQGCVSNNIRSD